MPELDLISLCGPLIIGGVSAFLAILLWSKTRDPPWILVIAGTLVNYGGIVFATFGYYGLLPEDVVFFPGILSLKTLFSFLPLVFFSIAFIVMIRRNRLG
ncbi:MAG: hypothetical protein LBQ61_01235 [Spirochaetales bacterium]|jgi:hypothetical protein|nr:hypothetical protein [Spirochaetales bacterium]